MQGAVHSLHCNMRIRSPFASSDRLRSLCDDTVMQEAQPLTSASVDVEQPQPSGVAQPFLPPTASVNIKQPRSSAATQPEPPGTEIEEDDELKKTMSCLEPLQMTGAYCCPITVPQRCSSADATMDTLMGQEYCLLEEGSEVVEESQGAAGDAYRFRYSRVSPEEGYSPIAGISPFKKAGTREVQAQHVWVSHEDADGAICSKPIYGPLAIVVRATDGSDHNFQVVGGMCVKNLKEKIWNMTGISPRNQCLIMSNGAAAEDTMEFAGSGMQQGEVLYLRTV